MYGTLFRAIMINVYNIIMIFSSAIIAVGIIINHVCFCFCLCCYYRYYSAPYTSSHDHVFLPTKTIQNNLHNIDDLIEWIGIFFFSFFEGLN